VPKAMRLLKFGFDKAARLIRDRLPQTAKAVEPQSQPVFARVSRQPINRLAAIKQSQSRWYSTKQAISNASRHFSSSTAPRASRSSFPASRTAAAVSRLTTRTPFATQLRPNLTGGTLSRSAGGYSLGGQGARHFSHAPAAQAQVVQNVSQAVRAFWLSGSKARFDGFNSRTGEKRYRAVSDLQDDVRQTLDLHAPAAKGAFIDFKISPIITAIGPLAGIPRSGTSTPSCETSDGFAEATGLGNPMLLSNLSIDFARALKNLSAVFNDLKHLSTLGDLPITLHNADTLRVRFPGVDADTVEALCLELNIRRGIVGQDEGFEEQCGAELALLFPFAPSRTHSQVDFNVVTRPKKRLRASKKDKVEWEHMLSPAQSPGYSHRSETSHSLIEPEELGENPWLSSPSGYSSLHSSELDGQGQDDVAMFFTPHHISYSPQGPADAARYEGMEGIHRFLQECERAQR